MNAQKSRISVIDSHTGGEPTRVVVAGGPDLGGGPTAAQLQALKSKHDWLRAALTVEPRGSDVFVGAILCAPADPSCVAGVIYFNSVGYLGMCGHGTIGVTVTLAHLGRIRPGTHRLETPVGIVTVVLHRDGSVSVTNVPSRRLKKNVRIDVPGAHSFTGDVAYGGNWFYLADAGELSLNLEDVPKLTEITWSIRRSVNALGFAEVDHVDLFGPPINDRAHSRNFVLCPGGAYDRSPCGTGTSAKLACLAADGALREGDEWVQESIVGSVFSGSFKWLDRQQGIIEPTIRGTAYVNAETQLILNELDPFRFGLTSPYRETHFSADKEEVDTVGV